jgi:hypothetical protein
MVGNAGTQHSSNSKQTKRTPLIVYSYMYAFVKLGTWPYAAGAAAGPGGGSSGGGVGSRMARYQSCCHHGNTTGIIQCYVPPCGLVEQLLEEGPIVSLLG